MRSARRLHCDAILIVEAKHATPGLNVIGDLVDGADATIRTVPGIDFDTSMWTITGDTTFLSNDGVATHE